jgi:hypothetical protein
MPALVIRRLDNGEEVHRVELNSTAESHVERVTLGMLSKYDTDRFYVDDSEVDAAREEEPTNRNR